MENVIIEDWRIINFKYWNNEKKCNDGEYNYVEL